MEINGSYLHRSIWQQRIGYGIADFACNLIWQMISLYLMYYYTDVLGLSLVDTGMVFLVIRLIDGLCGVWMGIAIDRTNTKWGKSRPYLLWGGLPFVAFSILTFYNPQLSKSGNLVYAFCSYAGLSISYTIVNTPLSAILPALTTNTHERTNLATSRIIFSFLGTTAVSALTLPLVKYLGVTSVSPGFFKTVVIFAVTAGAMIFLSFIYLREIKEERTVKIPVKQAFGALKSNYYWYIFALNIIFMWGAFFLQQGALVYFFTYNLAMPGFITLFASINSIASLAGTLLAPAFSKKASKRNLFLTSGGIYLAGLMIMIISGQHLYYLLSGAVISSLGFGFRHAIYFSMQADPVDYGLWKNGINSAGLIASINGFIGKLAMAGTGFMSGVILKLGKYAPNETQAHSALVAIKVNYLILPVVFTLISMAIIWFYRLDAALPKIREELENRNSKHLSIDGHDDRQ